jgi:hypothetical protein
MKAKALPLKAWKRSESHLKAFALKLKKLLAKDNKLLAVTFHLLHALRKS